MTDDRAAEIIAAYGAADSRWPPAERAAVLSKVTADPVLARARDDAGTLDQLLADWARAPVAPGDAGAAAAAAMAAVLATGRWRWAAGGGMIAAALAVAAMLVNPAAVPIAPTTVAAGLSDDAAFALMFTPTFDEETML